MKRLLILAGLFLGTLITPALAQSNCSYITYKAVLTAAQWNQCFSNKQDVLGFMPVPITGGNLTGKLVTVAPNAASAGLNLPPGSAPTSPVNGDIWSTTAGLYVQINGVTVGPLAQTIGPTIVSSLPSCVSGLKGRRAVVTDATAPTYLSALTGGSTVTVGAICNGSSWVAD